jgi:ABC-type nitrate/sulfonate/bicarbonate transport system ATPase subunit
MTAPLLRIAGLRKRFGQIDVLEDVDLEVGQGEFVSILGPSGAGKSTILQILTGAQEADAGRILFDGTPLSSARRPFAFMPQRDALMPWRRVIDNTTLGLEIEGVGRQQARARVAPLFAEFGLSGFERHYPAQLSGGMRQRAALLRTVVQNRPMLLLDEPFGALDALTRARMQHWLEAMREHHGWTVLLITHDVREAVLLSDRIYVLSPRPARVVREFTVPLPRPRRHATLPEGAAIESEILRYLLNTEESSCPVPA